jgi:hypothetical protein
MAEPLALKYRAFISYSHADTSWAKWLHRGLEGFRIDKDLVGHETSTGTIPKTLRPIFRDRDEPLAVPMPRLNRWSSSTATRSPTSRSR